MMKGTLSLIIPFPLFAFSPFNLSFSSAFRLSARLFFSNYRAGVGV
jgi:hypothetical protein